MVSVGSKKGIGPVGLLKSTNSYLRSKLNHNLYDSKFCVVSGIGRSGTTILRKSLEIHSEIHSTETENNLVYDLLEALDMSINRRSKSIKTSNDQHLRLFKNLILDTTFPEANSHSKINTLFCDLRIESFKQLLNIFGDNCKIVYIVRNGVEVVASRMTKPQFKHFTFEDNCKIWAQSMNVVKSALDSQHFLLLRHENMLNGEDLTVMYEMLFKHLKVSFQLDYVEFVKENFCHPTKLNSEDKQIKSLVNRKNRWSKFNEKDKETFMDICADAMDYFGYTIPN